MNINTTTGELMKIFRVFNTELFNGELEEPIIFVQGSAKKSGYGWFTPWMSWQNADGSIQKPEIAIVAESLNREPLDIAGTMLHEMIHLYNFTEGIKDGSDDIHNKKYKLSAEDHGLEVSKNGKFGWSITNFNEEGKRIAESIGINPDAFSMYRISEEQPEVEKKTTYKYTCEGCGSKFTLKLQINAECVECGNTFDVEEKEPKEKEE